MTPLILSADDFGLDADIDAAVLDLAERGRLTATSCLTMSPRWQAAARSLTPEVRARIDVGLHLDFTEFGKVMSLPMLIASSYARRLSRRDLQARIGAQLDAFEAATGVPPDYVDGHRHVHQLPQIRSVLLCELARRYDKARPWIRISRPVSGSGPKGAAIGLLGSEALTREAGLSGFRCTRRLLGVYGFDLTATAYGSKLAAWLDMAQPGDALMIHVARRASAGDPIGVARVQEYGVLNGDSFTAALTHAGVRPARGREVFGR
jgi:chitin disaccharide deacetylase